MHIPAPPIMVTEAGSLCECNMEFVSGFKGNWQLGPQKGIAAQFLSTIISTLKECDTNNTLGQVILPTLEAIRASLFNARYLGRKCILFGNSILRNVEAKLIGISADSGHISMETEMAKKKCPTGLVNTIIQSIKNAKII